MKTQIQKIIMIAAALLFVSSGVAFAHDWNDRGHKSPGKAHGHYKVQKYQKHHYGWNQRHFSHKPHYGKRYAYKMVRGHRYYDDHNWRPAPRKKVVHKVVKRDPVVVFKVVLKDLR